jgi:hypothetical protein
MLEEVVIVTAMVMENEMLACTNKLCVKFLVILWINFEWALFINCPLPSIHNSYMKEKVRERVRS